MNKYTTGKFYDSFQGKKWVAKNFQLLFWGWVVGWGTPTLLQELCSTGKN